MTTKRTGSTAFDLEPNPFEQSFSRTDNPEDKNKNTKTRAIKDGADNTNERDKNSEGENLKERDDSPKPTLPPLAAIASPDSQPYSQWPLAAAGITNPNSLRSGPLSPAMLSGPAHQP